MQRIRNAASHNIMTHFVILISKMPKSFLLSGPSLTCAIALLMALRLEKRIFSFGTCMGLGDDMVGEVAVYKFTDIHGLMMTAAGSKHENEEQNIGENYNNSKNKRYYPFHGKSPTTNCLLSYSFLTHRHDSFSITPSLICRLCHLL